MNINWQHDPVMNRLAEVLPVPTSYQQQDIYLALLSSIISQQLSTKVARVIRERFLSLFPDKYPQAELVLKLQIDDLKKVGLSTAKAGYVQNIARFHLDFPLSYEHLQPLPDEELIALFTQIKGVGIWTAQMVLMFPMNRPDVFPVDDLAIQQQMIKFYQIQESGKQLRERLFTIAENWRPHRTLACRYLWDAKDLVPLQS
ncbi:DNA-3-methyladenine glycosylase 2 family protein [Rhodocytophaga rosea]|uniref:DNA-3-methyladenine glycosylase II n=1 Tax=Rhodocytophaga rosea TaxID=2704465 RepID=A0A6C0GDG4_9BACT|nr:DNA-3-methyladenine glycosylase 2 family protein [Rhodocytophaga rosea]QHT65730.1 DNA-3-methyladenine glycosylase 2 family protein [Rhodocytophaga rosea]